MTIVIKKTYHYRGVMNGLYYEEGSFVMIFLYPCGNPWLIGWKPNGSALLNNDVFYLIRENKLRRLLTIYLAGC